MFVFSLTPFPIKASPVTYSWLGLLALDRFDPADVILIGSAFQMQLPSQQQHGPWVQSMLTRSLAELDARFAEARRIEVPQALIDREVDAFESPLAFFEQFVLRGVQSYRDWLRAQLDVLLQQGVALEAMFTLVNDRTLEDVGAHLGIPVIHSEGGGLRHPVARMGTFFFDFQGVNGNTEARARAQAALTEHRIQRIPCLAPQELLETVTDPGALDAARAVPANRYEIGFPLQVEDDSNVLLFNRGVTTLDMLYRGLRVYPAARMLLRQHPGAHFELADRQALLGLRCRFGDVDDSPSSLAFVMRCKRIMTLNSSVALESLMLDKPTWIFGESPLAFLADDVVDRRILNGVRHPEHRSFLLNWYVFGYLVPEKYWLQPGYTRWRLTRPSEREIMDVHKAAWEDVIATSDAVRA